MAESEKLPAPLTAPDCDLQDFGFMPLDVQRLRDSDLAAEQTPEENWAALLLWAASWHQIPAASVPDTDKWLAKHAGYMARGRISKEWEDIRPGAMRSFIKCSDGRWYHPVVAEKAREAWTSKLKQRLDTEKSRIKKHNERHGTQIPYPEFDQWVADGCPTGQPLPVPSDKKDVSPGQSRETGSKGQGEGQGQGHRQGSGVGPAAPPPAPTPVPTPAPTAAPAAATSRGARLPTDWQLPKAWGDWALVEYPLWNADKVRREGQKFRDHWVAKTGKDATKLDWLATWRNWCASPIAHRDDPKPPRGMQDVAARDAETRRLLGMEQQGAQGAIDARS